MAVAGPGDPSPTGDDPAPSQPRVPFSQFYTANFAGLARALTTMTDDTHAVHDAVQEAFVRARHCWDTIDKPWPWLYRTATRELWQQARRRPERPFATVDAPPVLDHADYVVQDAELRAAVRCLSQRRREVLVLHDIMGYTAGEIAETLHIRASTVRSHLALARDQLRSTLSCPGRTSEEDQG
jgi:RNA polymerase sigma-70 factor (ECF subfamily)